MDIDWKREQRARKIYHALRELYGNDITISTLVIRATIDGTITRDERKLLEEFITHWRNIVSG